MKKSSEYSRYADSRIDASKHVWMALAFSLAMRATEDKPEAAVQFLADEWRTLHHNEIVSQRPKLKPQKKVAS